MITFTASGLRKIEYDTPENIWPGQYNENVNILDGLNAIGGLAIVPRDRNPDTFLPSSRYFNVTQGYFVYGNMLVRSVGYLDQLAPASTTLHVWLDPTGNIATGPTLPTGRILIPLGYLVTDANIITSVIDYRMPLTPIGGPLRVSRIAIAANYTYDPYYNYIRADATNGPLTITFANPIPGQLIAVRKVDTSANAVTLFSDVLIEGNTTYVLAARGSVMIAANVTPTYEVII